MRERGADAFRELLEGAKPSIEFKLDPAIDKLREGFESPSAIARRAEAMIREMTPREEWDRWRVYVAGRLKVNVDDLRNSRFLANSANFTPRFDGAAGSRYTGVRGRDVLEPVTFEREVLGIMIEEPMLVAEYAQRIPPQRFRSDLYRRTYERLVQSASTLRNAADVFSAFEDDEPARELLVTLGQRDRSSLVRYGDSDERRAHLDRIVERLEREDETLRYARGFGRDRRTLRGRAAGPRSVTLRIHRTNRQAQILSTKEVNRK